MLKTSPWGPVQQEVRFLEPAKGADFVPIEQEPITAVYTASHGGLKVKPDWNAHIPNYMRVPSGWYEEDCDFCLPVVCFRFRMRRRTYGAAVKTFLQFYPSLFEKFYKLILPKKYHTREDAQPGAYL